MERVICFLKEWEPYRADLARLAGNEGDEHQGHGGLQPELGVLSSVISTIVITISCLSSNIWDTVNNVNWNTVSRRRSNAVVGKKYLSRFEEIQY